MLSHNRFDSSAEGPEFHSHRTPVVESAGGTGGAGFLAIPASGVVKRSVDWLIPDVIPVGMLSALTGDEGIGKGLFTCYLIAQVTTGKNPRNVLLMAGEDDWSTMLRPRLEAAGADMGRVYFFSRKGSQGMPCLPEELEELRNLVRMLGNPFIIIDPWLSVVSVKKKVRDTQDARQVFDTLSTFVKEERVACLLVGHTNRSESGSSRNRYGGSIAIRQVARVCLLALPDPSGPDGVIIGVDKSNISSLCKAVRYSKNCKDNAWFISVHSDQYGLTVSEHLVQMESRDRRSDRRRTEHRDTALRVLQEDGVLTRSDVVDMYLQAGSTESAADKALSRWVNGDDAFLNPLGHGRYEPLDPPGPPAPPVVQETEEEPW